MNIWMVPVLLGVAACSARQETSLVSDEGVDTPAAGEAPQEACVASCLESSAMQARSPQAIEETCRQRCSGESGPLSPQSVE
jgi:hypothetical protein